MISTTMDLADITTHTRMHGHIQRRRVRQTHVCLCMGIGTFNQPWKAALGMTFHVNRSIQSKP